MISIVYVNYKTASLVIDSIKSVKENTTVDYEIIEVVDNASGDFLDLIRNNIQRLFVFKQMITWVLEKLIIWLLIKRKVIVSCFES